MRKLLLPILISLSTLTAAESPKGFFGFSLFDSAEDKVHPLEIKEKVRNAETISDFYDISVKFPPKPNPYFENYYLVLDSENIIHGIQGQKSNIINLETCKKEMVEIKNAIEGIYNIRFDYEEKTNPGFVTKRYRYYDKDSNWYSIQCNQKSNRSVSLLIGIDSAKFNESVIAFYNRGF